METLNKDLKQNHLYTLVLASFLVVTLAVGSFWQLKQNYLALESERIQAKASTIYQHYMAWNKLQRATVYAWSGQPELIKMTLQLLTPSSMTEAKLTNFAFNDYLLPLLSQSEFVHYYLLDTQHHILSSSHQSVDELTPTLSALDIQINQGLQGFSAISPPILTPSKKVRLYTLAPVRSVDGKVLALLVLEIDPDSSFYSLFDKAAFGETGEAYLFGITGQILSSSRALGNGHVGYFPNSVTNLKVPPVLTTTVPFQVSLTSGYQIEKPYLNYQQQPVIGAWVWDKSLSVGVAVEQSAEEFQRLLSSIQQVFILFVGAVVISIAAFLGVLVYGNLSWARKGELIRQTLTAKLDQLHREKTHEIEAREARYRSIIDTAWDAIFAVDTLGTIQSLNPAAGRIFGGNASSYLGLPLGHLIQDFSILSASEGTLSHRGMSFETTARSSDGALFPVAVSVSSSSHHSDFAHIVIVKDISKQKDAERSIKAIQERLELSQSFAGIGTWEWHITLDQVICTDMALKLMGVEQSTYSVSMAAFTNHVFADELEGLTKVLQRAVSQGKTFSYECRVRASWPNDESQSVGIDTDLSGDEWVLLQGTPLQSEKGAAKIIGHVQRITARKHNEVALRDARNMLRMVLDTIPSGVYWKDSSLRYAGVNSRFAKDVGKSAEEILGCYDQDIYQDAKQASYIGYVDRSVMQSCLPRLNEHISYSMNNGAQRQIEISRLPIIGDGRTPIGMLGVYSDITERVEAQKSLHQHHRLLAAIYTTQQRYFAHADKMEIFATLLQELLLLTESEYGLIGRVCYTPEQQIYLKTFAITDISWDENTRSLYQSKAKEGLEFYNLDTLFGHTLKTAELVLTNDPAQDPRATGVPVGHPPLKSYLGIPIMIRDQMVGMVAIANRAAGYDQSMVDFLRPMLTTCANLITALDNADAIAETQTQLLRAKNSAEHANLAKTEFLSRMSHELRTPMNAILGFTRLLKEIHPEEDEPREFLEEIDKAGQHLMVLINEVLDLERIESGRIELSITSVDVVVLVDDCISILEPMAQQYAVQLETLVRIDGMDGALVKGDVMRIKQILLNLISNAIKYNRPNGTVRVELAYKTSETLEIAVYDTGYGIAEALQSQLFEPFNRLSAENSGIEGSGMGLVISQRLAEMMNGSLGYSSQVDEGSCFWVCLPLYRSHHDEEALAIGQSMSSAHNKTILYGTSMHDFKQCCVELEGVLTPYEPSLEHVESAMQFLESALQNQYKLLILDEAMNDISLEDMLAYLNDADTLSDTALLVLLHSSVLKEKISGPHVVVHVIGMTPSDEVMALF